MEQGGSWDPPRCRLLAAAVSSILARDPRSWESPVAVRVLVGLARLAKRVDDVFVITDANNQALSDPQLCERLQQTIIDTLSSTQPTAQEYSSPIAIGP